MGFDTIEINLVFIILFKSTPLKHIYKILAAHLKYLGKHRQNYSLKVHE